jgi:hypothetical protein
MNAARLLYRTRQFWQALRSPPFSEDSKLIHSVLAPAQVELFGKMQASEQAHSLRVLRALIHQGETHPDLLVAALLHDAGKSRVKLRIWERVAIVLVKALCPGCEKRWGEGRAEGWRRAFVVSARHPEWGAELAAGSGASPLAASLIRRHQEDGRGKWRDLESLEDRLLEKLVAVDDES